MTLIVFLAMIKVIAIKLAKLLIAKLLKLGHAGILFRIICMLLFACRFFSANN